MTVKNYYFSYGILEKDSIARVNVMEFSKLTAKHQATIPKPIRNKLALQAGDYIQFQERDGQIVVTKVERIDHSYLESIGATLESEWLSSVDEEAYGDL